MDAEMAKAAQAIVDAHPRPSRALPRFEPLTSGDATPAAVAIDGSHAIVADTSAAWVVAVRVAAIAWPGPRQPAPIRLHVATPAGAQGVLDEACARLGIAAPPAPSAQSWGEALRGIAETEATLASIRAAAGRLVLVDGALHGLPRHAQSQADLILAEAQRHGVTVVAVAKRSTLEADGAAVVPWLHSAGPPGCWAAPLSGETFVARLHARAEHAFRVDAQRIEDVAALLPLCRDAAYVGYPYPLAVAHNEAAITMTETQDLAARLESSVRALGGPEAARRLGDFHAVLDRNVPR